MAENIICMGLPTGALFVVLAMGALGPNIALEQMLLAFVAGVCVGGAIGSLFPKPRKK